MISFHGMQKRRIVEKGDDYYRHCYETYRLIVDRLSTLRADQTVMCFQSRFGSEEWITPYTETVVKNLIDSVKSLTESVKMLTDSVNILAESVQILTVSELMKFGTCALNGQ